MDWFVEMPEVEVVQVDGFEDLVNRSVTALGDSYGVVTRHAKFLWKMTWDFGTKFNSTYCSLMSTWAGKRFLEVVARGTAGRGADHAPDVQFFADDRVRGARAGSAVRIGAGRSGVGTSLVVRPALGADHLRHRRGDGAHALLRRAPRAHPQSGLPHPPPLYGHGAARGKAGLRRFAPRPLPAHVRRRGQRHARLLRPGADDQDRRDADHHLRAQPAAQKAAGGAAQAQVRRARAHTRLRDRHREPDERERHHDHPRQPQFVLRSRGDERAAHHHRRAAGAGAGKP